MTESNVPSFFTRSLSWLVGAGLLLIAGWVLIQVPQKHGITPMVRSGTEHVLYLYRQGLDDYYKDFGAFPDPTRLGSREASIVDTLNADNPKKHIYLHPAYLPRDGFAFIDGWRTPIRFDPANAGRLNEVVSAGEDLVFGTQDDISSLTARTRDIPLPQESIDRIGGKVPPFGGATTK